MNDLKGNSIDKYFDKPVLNTSVKKELNLEDLNPTNDILKIDNVVGMEKEGDNDSQHINIAQTLTDDEKVLMIYKLQDEYYNEMRGKIYRHFKGHIYKVTNVTISTETLKPLVSYVRIDGKGKDRLIEWTRPLDMFLSPVDKDKYPDADQNNRFEPV